MWFFHDKFLNFLCDASECFYLKPKQVIAEFIIMDQRPHFHYDLSDLDITVQRETWPLLQPSLHLNEKSTVGTDFFTDPCIKKETSMHWVPSQAKTMIQSKAWTGLNVGWCNVRQCLPRHCPGLNWLSLRNKRLQFETSRDARIISEESIEYTSKQ